MKISDEHECIVPLTTKELEKIVHSAMAEFFDDQPRPRSSSRMVLPKRVDCLSVKGFRQIIREALTDVATRGIVIRETTRAFPSGSRGAAGGGHHGERGSGH